MKNLYIIILMLFSFTMTAQQTYNFEKYKIEVKSSLEDSTKYETKSINIKFETEEDRKLELYDILGRVVFKECTNKIEFQKEIHKVGIYLLKITEGENSTIRKVFVRKS